MNNSEIIENLDGSEIAIIGISCRFPGARNHKEFWQNLKEGKESITPFTDEELIKAGVESSYLKDPSYVKVGSLLEDYDKFDAQFFGYSPQEAELMDPQHRVFIECVWEAFEDAGYNPEDYKGDIGAFSGAKTDTYLLNIAAVPDYLKSLNSIQVALGNDLGCLSTRLAYKFNLRGPSYAVHTACSTSLVAVHLACQSLLIDECQMAVAGGVTVNVPNKTGYFYQSGGVSSPDGHCRAFDAEAGGTVFGNGVGAVVLKRLEDAIRDGDYIYSVIKGSAVNNDGSQKASFTAPGVEGQTKVVMEAMASAGIDADTISYVEAHGTGTNLGDPIEVTALTNAFRASTDKKRYCAIGSVKTNIGHLDAAAGISSLIKTALSINNGMIPPSLNYTKPNPKIDFDNSPFFVNDRLTDWNPENGPRRAGVSSFGFGSTNAHMILEEAPGVEESEDSEPYKLLLLSARSEAALEESSKRLEEYIRQNPGSNLADIAYTLKVGRKVFAHRKMIVCKEHGDAIELMGDPDSQNTCTDYEERNDKPVIFMFPGQGAQYVDMAKEIYQREPYFKAELDRCAEILKPLIDMDIRTVLFPDPQNRDTAAEALNQTYITQPVLFTIEYSLAKLFMKWGIKPKAMIGHSIGEYVAACVAGVLTPEDALLLVAQRGKLMQSLPGGAMLSVCLSEKEIEPYRNKDISLATSNSPELNVVSGTYEAIDRLQKELEEKSIQCRRLHTSHAFHSAMMEPVLDSFAETLKGITFDNPKIPYISNVTGKYIADSQVKDPAYWTQHLRGTVRFSDGIQELLKETGNVFLEVGPGQTLSTFVRKNESEDGEASTILNSLRHPKDQRPDMAFLMATLGKLWIWGGKINWKKYYENKKQKRIPLPTYPFERERYWVEALDLQASVGRSYKLTLDKVKDMAEWFYEPSWVKNETPENTGELKPDKSSAYLVFEDEIGLGKALAEQISGIGCHVVRIKAGEQFIRESEGEYTINPLLPGDLEKLFDKEIPAGVTSLKIMHLWTVNHDDEKLDEYILDAQQKKGYESLVSLAQAIGNSKSIENADILIVSSNMQKVDGKEKLQPGKATILGPCRVIPKEFSNISCRSMDIVLDESDKAVPELAEAVLSEICSLSDNARKDNTVAYREGIRWVYEARHCVQEKVRKNGDSSLETASNEIRKNGVYLITGGLGGIGFVLAEYLAKTAQAKLILTGRSELPDRNKWDEWLAQHSEKDAVSLKIKKVQALEAMGSQVKIICADTTDREKMRSAIYEAESGLGKVNGIIHAAGIAGMGMIQQKNAKMSSDVFNPKINGALVLYDIFAGRELDFMILCSSLQSIMGDLGQADYCAANAFLDAFAGYCRSKGLGTVTALDWDNWQEVGIAAETQVPENMRAYREEILSKAISSKEGVDIFRRVLISKQQQVIISAQPLTERIELSSSFNQSSLMGNMGSPVQEASNNSTGAKIKSNLSRNDLQNKVSDIWKRVLGVKKIGPNDNFFDLGGNSLTGLQLVSEIKRVFDIQIAPVVIYEAPTVSSMAKYLGRDMEDDKADESGQKVGSESAENALEAQKAGGSEIAIVGMSCRFPGANNVDEFWKNLCDGVESVTPLTDEELMEAGIDPKLLSNPNYVKAAPIIQDFDMFDAEFFGYTPREAEMMDPQHRLFLQCAWESLENAGYTQDKYKGLIGVFAGASLSTYMFNLYSNPKLIESVGNLQAIIGNDKDSLTTSVSYKLNLKGPSIAVQTFCSTSLVAVHLAAKSLLSGECHMALAGGATVNVPQKSGYMYNEGGILSPDGHCRAFDRDAGGMLFGNGVGIVVLKRLKDALADGDSIIAVVKGSAINNDGSLKVGYTAPSVEGQSEVIANALKNAGVDAGSIGYIEAHGTGTAMGDPIEVAALTKAFRAVTQDRGYCAIGSVKSNIGHLDRAAGIAGLIKTALSLKYGMIPPSLNYNKPNPKIDFESSPFFVNTSLAKWDAGDTPRRAGVSALGFGGTNAHIILEEAPSVQKPDDSRPYQLLMVSGRTQNALESNTKNLYDYLKNNEILNLADAAYTLQTGRRDFKYRKAMVCTGREDALSLLGGEEPRRVLTGEYENDNNSIVFMFPGQGSQYPDMGLELYRMEPVFRQEVDYCAEVLKNHMDLNLLNILYPESPEDREKAGDILSRTRYTQPAVFVIEYAMAKLLCSWGIVPDAMIGHSIGEYVAAVLAGVMNLDDALMLVAARGRMIQELPGGTMLSVPMNEKDVIPLLNEGLSMAAVNSPDQCVISGSAEDINLLKSSLSLKGVECRELYTSHAFHSVMMEPILEPFKELVSTIELKTPQIPYVSCATGTWIQESEAIDPGYWAQHLRKTVLFANGISEVLKDRSNILIEAGPGQTLSKLARRNVNDGIDRCILSSIRHPNDKITDMAFLLNSLGKLWIAGKQPDWSEFYKQEKRRHIPLPTYSFECKRYWIEKMQPQTNQSAQFKTDIRDWMLIPSWKRSNALNSFNPEMLEKNKYKWLIFIDEEGIGQHLAQRLLASGQEAATVAYGERFTSGADNTFKLNSKRTWEYAALISRLNNMDMLPDIVVYLWNYSEKSEFGSCQAADSYSLLSLAQSIEKAKVEGKTDLWVVSCSTADIDGEESLQPEKTAVVGMCRAISRNSEKLLCRSIDILPGIQAKKAADNILSEILSNHSEVEAAFRGRYRWIPDFEETNAMEENNLYRFKEKSTYIIMDGLSGTGFDFARFMAKSLNARLILPQPFRIPDRKYWDAIIAGDNSSFDYIDIQICKDVELQQSKADNHNKDIGMDNVWAQLKESDETVKPPKGLESELNRLCMAYIHCFFTQDLNIEKGIWYKAADLRSKLDLSHKFERFFDFMLSVLEQGEIIELTGDAVRFVKDTDETAKPELLSAKALKKYPEIETALKALKHCVDNYRKVLSGSTDTMDVFSPESGCNVLEAVDSAQKSYSNVNQIQKVISEYFCKNSGFSPGRKLRILEINAGDDRLTWTIADALRDSGIEEIEYVFSSQGRSIVSAAEKNAAQKGLGFMRFRHLDITRDPGEQGFDKYSFDYIVGINTVHAQPEISKALDNIVKLLVPGGRMILVEATKPQLWVNMIWGLSDSWWNYKDEELRTNSPLLTSESWKKVLKQSELTDTAVFPGIEEDESDHSLITACQRISPDSSDYSSWLMQSKKKELILIKDKVEKLKELEKLGSSVLTPYLEESTGNYLAETVNDSWAESGSIQGIIYTPFEKVRNNELKTAEFKDADIELYRENLKLNIKVLDSLASVLSEINPDFTALMCSDSCNLQKSHSYSIEPLYSYMNWFVHKHREKIPGLSLIRWDGWENDHICGNPDEEAGNITPENGADILSCIISDEDKKHTIISPRNISLISEEWNRPWLKKAAGRDQIDTSDTADDRPLLQNTYMAPQNETEQKILKVWQGVLGISKIGVNDSFFEIGGDSLQATQLTSRMRDQFGVDLPMQVFFDAPTISETAAAIEDLKNSKEKEAEEEIMKMIEQLSEDEIDAEIMNMMKNLE